MKKFISVTFIIFLLVSASAYPVSQGTLSKTYGSYLKALIYFENGRLEESLSEFRKLRKLDPDSTYIRLKIAFLLVKLGELDEAEKELKEVKRLDPQNLETSLGLIFLYSYSGRDKELEAEYGDFLEKAHQLRPEDIKISEYLAQFYFYKKKLDEAIRVYEAVVEAHPDYIDAHYLLGYFYEEDDQRQKAISAWKKIIQLRPLHADALNSLGYIYAQEGQNLDEAEKMIKKALEQDPNNGAYLDSLGWVYFNKKEYKKAEEYLEKAVGYTKDPVIYEHLGDLYIELSDSPRAVEYYKQGLSLAPESLSLKEKIEQHEKQEDRPSQEKSQQNTETDS